nr:hypothetical protein [Tanacetum cinerariifolium]
MKLFKAMILSFLWIRLMKLAIILQTRTMDILLARGSLFPLSRITLRTLGVKYDIERVMLHNGFFIFQISSRKGLSLISTKLRRPIMLDAYISNMCVKSWGRNTYVWALIEVLVENVLIDSLILAIPFPKGMGHTMKKIDVEYEWQPPRCGSCKIFDHNDECGPTAVKAAESTKAYDDGFVEVTRKKVNLASSIIDGDIEEVEEVFVEKDLSIGPMDGEVDDA